jgi:hypothetical protein
MKQFFSRHWLAAGLVVLAAGVGPARAGSCGPAGCGVGVVGVADYGYGDYGYGSNWAWIYPDGGFTLYPGQAGSCVPSHSDYSKVNWLVPPTASAQAVLNKLQQLGIPQVPPETIYLGKNPNAGEAKLPLPKGWTQKEVEPKEAAKDKDPEKLDVKPKIDEPKKEVEPKGKVPDKAATKPAVEKKKAFDDD